jgi:hypothetical protein
LEDTLVGKKKEGDNRILLLLLNSLLTNKLVVNLLKEFTQVSMVVNSNNSNLNFNLRECR